MVTGCLSQSGIRGLWRGNGSAMLRVMPYSATVFMTYDKAELYLKHHIFDKDVNQVMLRFSAGAIAGVTATAVTYPFDLIR